MGIKRIDVTNFGSFKDFTWNNYLGTHSFAKQNIIYGRNYSGKTTLSRLFRWLETKEIHDDYADGKFNLTLANGETLTNFAVAESTLNVRVYNSDFRKEHLSLLFDKDGTIRPFAIVGERNVETQEKLKQLNVELEQFTETIGDEAKRTGLVGQVAVQKEGLANLTKQLERTLVKEAGEIAENEHLFKSSVLANGYDAERLVEEIPLATKLTDEETAFHTSIIEETEKTQPEFQMIDVHVYDELVEEIKGLVEKEIRPSKAIRELIENELLQQWVAGGVRLHRHERDNCAFCQSKISDERWKELDDHFTEESENYKRHLNNVMKRISDEFKRWEQFKFLEKEQLYVVCHARFEEVKREFLAEKEVVLGNLKKLHYIVRQRFENVFVKIEVPESVFAKSADTFREIDTRVEAVILENSTYFADVTVRQDEARRQLRLAYIAELLDQLDYVSQCEEIEKVKVDLEVSEGYLEEERRKQFEVMMQKKATIGEFDDEHVAVLQVNEYLKRNVHYPNLELAFAPVDEVRENDVSGNYQFQILRDGEPAHQLSEGEQSLIAFCYFMATLKTIENPEDWIIFIDDPLVSLDDNNLYFVFKLIDQEIRRKGYGQFFLSTHRLEWLKYFYTIADEEMVQLTEQDTRSFLMEKRKHDGSLLLPMPNL